MHIAIWLVTLVCLGLWSLSAWGMAALMGLDPSWLDELNPLLLRVPGGDWLDHWLPGWQAQVSKGLDLVHVLLGWLGSTGHWLALGIWAVGAVGIVATGGLLSLLVAVVRRATPPTPAARVEGAAAVNAR